MKHVFRFSFGCLLGLLLLVGPVARAQAPAWQLATALGQTTGTNGQIIGMATDASGNVYTTGSFSGTVTFGNTTLVGGSGPNGFVAKWSPVSGSYVWARQYNGASLYAGSSINSIAVSGAGVYIIGACNGVATFGSITSAPGTGQGDNDGFVAKLTDAGSSASWTWVQRFGGSADDYCAGVAANGSAVYVAGTYRSPTLVLGSATVLTIPAGFAG